MFDDYSFASRRFCEPGVEDSKFADPRTWIFGVWGDQHDAVEVSADYFEDLDAGSCKSDANYESDDAFAWDCDMAVLYADDGTDHNVTTIRGLDFTRLFDPKSSGFEKVKEYIVDWMHQKRGARALCTPILDDGVDLVSLAEEDPEYLCNFDEPTQTTSETAPSTTITSPPPTGTCSSMCDCDGNQCFAGSPECCPNGTCDDSC